MAAHLKLDLSPLKWLVRKWHGRRHLPPPLPKLWGKRYSTFVRRRFMRYAHGGGDWKPLKPATIARRRGEGVGARILWDTGTVLAALVIGASGNLFKQIRKGVRFGFGGPGRHPDGGASIADLGRWHDTGAGRLPKRRIIVEPDNATIRGMLADMKRTNRPLMAITDAKARAALRRMQVTG